MYLSFLLVTLDLLLKCKETNKQRQIKQMCKRLFNDTKMCFVVVVVVKPFIQAKRLRDSKRKQKLVTSFVATRMVDFVSFLFEQIM